MIVLGDGRDAHPRDAHRDRPRRDRGLRFDRKRDAKCQWLQVRRRHRRRAGALGDLLDEGEAARKGVPAAQRRGTVRALRQGRGERGGGGEEESRRHRADETQRPRRRRRLQVSVLQARRRALGGRQVHHGAGAERQRDDSLRPLRRPGRASGARREGAVLGRVRSLESDRLRAQRLQRAPGRHDLLRHRGAGLRARRHRDDAEAEVAGLQDQPRPEAVGQGAWVRGLLRALGRPRVHQRLLARGEHVPLLQRRRRPWQHPDRRQRALQARREGVSRLQPDQLRRQERYLPLDSLG